MTARQFVFELLLRLNKSGAYSNLILDSALKKCALSGQDKAFATSLFYGVIEKQLYLDYQLSLALTQPLKKLRPEVLITLRMGVYQLLLMDKVPDSAAINESVKLIKKNRCAFAAGLVNAVLRNIQRSGARLPDETAENYLSVKYAVPQSLIDLWIEDYGKETCLGILESLEEMPQTVVRVNTLCTSAQELIDALAAEGVEAHPAKGLENALVIEKTGALHTLRAFENGLFHIEDTAAQKAALLIEAQPGERILDCCAAPGGKSFTIAEEMGRGEIVACDIYPQRVALIETGAHRLHIDCIKTCVQDATIYNSDFGAFDRVLCDVPCSGLGIIRKKPEIRFKTPAEIADSAHAQLQILKTAFRYLKPGGTLVYATCTLHKAENEAVIDSFMKEHSAEVIFQKTFFPHIDHTDGFYAAVIKKNEE
ncbi:MAG: 16S rRNA (cytosine(967)-C(5))-methyltransferase RsmB [Clostridia bacterium]|nr:16S rRNA (cytosine(967)-C(5))-methyltransferase RsmB [Clostridia bacterium]